MAKPKTIKDYARAFASKGGKARAAKLTSAERRAIALKGGRARAAQRKKAKP